MKTYKFIFTIFIVMILLSLSAASAVDLEDNCININNDNGLNENILNENHLNENNLNENSFNEESLFLSENVEEDNIETPSDDSQMEDNSLKSTTNMIYVDAFNGDDSNDGSSLENSLKSFGKALDLSENNYTIYLANGDYSGLENTRLTINKSLNIIGDENTTFNGLNENYIFIIENDLTIIFKNIRFINGNKASSITDSDKVYGGALEIKSSKVTIDNCRFINNTLDFSDEKYKYGGAISNFGDLTIRNSYFYNNSIISYNRMISFGGAIYNKGNLTVSNSSFIESKGDKYTYGATIYNDGKANMENGIIANSYSKEESKGSAIYNKGNFTLRNSIIENNTVERLNFNYIQGNIFNSGLLIAVGNIFRNNSGYYKQPNSEYEGSPNIYSVGDLNLSYNVFVDNAPFNKICPDVYVIGGRDISIDNNFWTSNNNPFNEQKINLDIVNSWIVLDLKPEYSNIAIGQSLDFIASLKSSNDESIDINLLPKQNINFLINDELILEKEFTNGISAFDYTFGEKGRYSVSASLYNLTNTVIVDVGKKESFIDFNISENINYTEDLEINLTAFDGDSNPLDGNVSILLNNDKYSVNLIGGKGNITISNLMPNNYTLKLIYEGNEDYGKAIGEKNFTINKSSVDLTIDIEDIDIGETGNAIIKLDSQVIPGKVNLYINGDYKETLTLYNETTTLTLNGFARGEYLIEVEFEGTAYYESVNASALFKVKGLEETISVSCEDIKIGNNATVVIESNADDLSGNAILSINGQEYEIYLENRTTNITLIDLTNGTYDIKVIYKGNSKYEPANASCSFDVSKYSSELIVDIIPNEESQGNENGIFTGNIIVKTEPNNCTGTITLFVNIRQYSLDLNDGTCNFSVEFDKGTNYIFAFYEGDYYFEPNSWNATYGAEDEFYLIGYDINAYEYNDFNYTVLLVEENGMTMPNRIVNVSFNGEDHTVITDNQGKAYFPLNLNIGEYSINASYKNKTVTNKITIKPIEFDLTVFNISYGENKSIEINFNMDNSNGEGSESNSGSPVENASINGRIHLKIIDIDKNIEIVNEEIDIQDNKALYDMSQMNVGNYSICAKYMNDLFNSSEKNASFNIKKSEAILDVECNDIIFGETAQIVAILPNAVGTIHFNVNGTIYDVEIYSSSAILNLSNLNPGTYPVSIAFDGDSNYNPSQVNAEFSVRNSTTPLELSIDNSEYGKNITVIAKLNEDAEGNVTFKINDLIHISEIEDGTASWTFNDLEVGIYTLEAIYSGDKAYIPADNSTSFEIYKANSFINLYTKDVCLDENIRIYANLSKNATGTVTFSIEGYYSPREKNVVNSTSYWYISPLEEGTYTVIATYNGDKNYFNSTCNYLLNVSKIRALLTVEIKDRNVNDTISINAKLISANNEKLSGNVTVTIGSKTYKVSIKNGTGSLNIGKMDIGNYSFTAKYEGSTNYSEASSSGEFKVIDNFLNAKLEYKDFREYYNAKKQLVIKLVDSNNKPISGETIYFCLKQKAYKVTTDSDGNAKITINLNSGDYDCDIIFNESKSYHNLSGKIKVTVLKTVQASDLTKKYNTSGQYLAIFYNPNGKALGNAKVQLTITKKKYNFTTLANGVLRININLNPGKYTIKATNPVSGETVKNTIFIFQNIMENKNITKYYKASSVYKVRVYGNDGKAVGAKQVVTFKLNGVTYKHKTDEDGYASLKIKSLKPGTYTITATYNKFKVSNKVVVKPVLTANNVSIKKGNKIKFTVKLVNTKGKALKGKKITFKLKNKKYTAKTNSKGVATLNKKIALKVGSYKIQSIYGSSKITNTIKIKK